MHLSKSVVLVNPARITSFFYVKDLKGGGVGRSSACTYCVLLTWVLKTPGGVSTPVMEPQQSPPVENRPPPQPPPSLAARPASGRQPHLVDHHLPLEDGHEMQWLLAHRDADLDRLVVVLLVQDDGLIGRGGDLIRAGLAALGGAEGKGREAVKSSV